MHKPKICEKCNTVFTRLTNRVWHMKGMTIELRALQEIGEEPPDPPEPPDDFDDDFPEEDRRGK